MPSYIHIDSIAFVQTSDKFILLFFLEWLPSLALLSKLIYSDSLNDTNERTAVSVVVSVRGVIDYENVVVQMYAVYLYASVCVASIYSVEFY